MSSDAKKTLIGAFVLGAVALATIGVTVLGAGKLFRHRPTFVMYFSGSITGLTVGAPVEFRGVRVGEVTKIAATFDPRDLSIQIPVHVELDPRSLIVANEQAESAGVEWGHNPEKFYKPLLDKGLKAQLEVQSLVTMQLFITIDFHPEMPTKLVGLDPRYPEIPTIPSLKDQIAETLQRLPDKIMSAADAVEQLVRSPEVKDGVQDLGLAIRDLDLLLREVRSEIKPLAASVKGSSDAARRAFAQAETTLAFKEGPPAEMAASIAETSKKASAALEQMQATLAAFETLASQNAYMGYDVSKTLQEVEAAARATRLLAESAELHPEALLKGKR
jgi:paraquat-inducible protein B